MLTKVDSVTEGSYTYDIYENPYALPLAYAVQSNVQDWKSAWYNPFEAQNSLYTLMTGNSSPMYNYEAVTVDLGSASIASVNESTSTAFYMNPSDSSQSRPFQRYPSGWRSNLYLYRLQRCQKHQRFLRRKKHQHLSPTGVCYQRRTAGRGRCGDGNRHIRIRLFRQRICGDAESERFPAKYADLVQKRPPSF